MFRFFSSFLFFPLFFIYGGVENYLETISFPVVPRSLTSANLVEKSAFVRQNFHPEYVQLAERSKSIIDQKEIEKKLADCLSFRFQTSGDLVVSLAREWQPLELNENFNIKLISCAPDELVSNSFVSFELWNQGTLFNKFSFPIRLSLMEEVYFAKTPLLRGVDAKKEFFFTRKVDTLKHHANSVPISTNLSSYEVNTNLRADAPLKWNFLSKVTLVKKGSVVDVFASGNGIYVTMKGVALEDGVEGSQVRVRNLSSDKEFHAKVLNSNSVKVYL